MITESLRHSPHNVSVPAVSDAELTEFVRDMGNHTMYARSLFPQFASYESPPHRLPQSDAILPTCSYHPDDCELGPLLYYTEHVQIDLSKCHDIEQETRAQPLCKRWHHERRLRLTASNFGRIVSCRADFQSLAMDLHSPQNISHVPAVKLGIQAEKVAKQKFLKNCSAEKMYDCGLVVNPALSYLACSPDGLVYIDGQPSLVECKALYMSKGKTVLQVIDNRSTSCLALSGPTLSLKENHYYFFQLQGQMAITGMHSCYFVITADLAEEPFVQRVMFAPDVWQNMVPKLRDFYFTHFLPHACDIN